MDLGASQVVPRELIETMVGDEIIEEPSTVDDEMSENFDDVLLKKLDFWLQANGPAAMDNWLLHSDGVKSSFLKWIAVFAQDVLEEYLDESFEAALDAALVLYIQRKSNSVSAAMVNTQKKDIAKVYKGGKQILPSVGPNKKRKL